MVRHRSRTGAAPGPGPGYLGFISSASPPPDRAPHARSADRGGRGHPAPRKGVRVHQGQPLLPIWGWARTAMATIPPIDRPASANRAGLCQHLCGQPVQVIGPPSATAGSHRARQRRHHGRPHPPVAHHAGNRTTGVTPGGPLRTGWRVSPRRSPGPPRPKPAKVPKPQSLPAITRSVPRMSVIRRSRWGDQFGMFR